MRILSTFAVCFCIGIVQFFMSILFTLFLFFVVSRARRNASLEEMCRNPRLKADVMQELETVSERAGLQRFEKVIQ